MGYPSTGCETIYRNSLSDTLLFFQKYHNSNVKVFCLINYRFTIYVLRRKEFIIKKSLMT